MDGSEAEKGIEAGAGKWQVIADDGRHETGYKEIERQTKKEVTEIRKRMKKEDRKMREAGEGEVWKVIGK